MSVSPWAWAALLGSIVMMLVLDLKVVMREPHRIGRREGVLYSAVWIGLGVAFTGVVFLWLGGEAATDYITAYLVEKSLSIDNVFVWSLIFTYFSVPGEYRHRVLFWGIFGALAFRAAFIFGGVALLETIHWAVYGFGAILLFTAYQVFQHDDVEVHPDENPVVKAVHRFLPSIEEYRENRFFVRDDGRLKVTPLVTVLVAIETADILFAVDSVPAVLGVTRSTFLAFSSNAFAILGLRALFFLVDDLEDRFRYLNKGLAVILAFISAKFFVSELVEIPSWTSLVVVGVVLTVTIVASRRAEPESEAESEPDDTTEFDAAGQTAGRHD